MSEKGYIGLKDLNTADKLADKRKSLEQLRYDDARNWALNRAFYRNSQWVEFDPALGQVIKLPDGAPRWKVRLTSNQITPGVQHYIAQMTKTWPTVYATPDSGSERDRKSAEMATRLFEYWNEEFSLRAKTKSVLTHAQLSGGFWKISWDALAGKPLNFLMNPESGQPITDDELADVFRDEVEQLAEQQGVDPKLVLEQFEKTVYVGEIKVEVVPVENVLLDPTSPTFEDCKWAICRHPMDPDDIRARFKKDVEPDSIPSETDVTLFFNDKKDKTKTTKNVYIGYFRPTPAMPKGRYVIWMEDPMEILMDTDWPYPFDELPLVKFPGIERPDMATDEARVTLVRPLQKELNRFISSLSEFRNLTLKPQIIAPLGSLRQRITSEPGAVFEAQPINGLMPEWRPVPGLPSGVYAEGEDIQNRIDKLFNRLPSERSSLPARVDSGNSIELLQEAVADQMSPEIQGLEDALVRAGTLMVKLAQKYYIEPRLLKIKGSGGSVQVKKFMNADLEGGFSFNVESGTGLPRSRAGRQQRVMEIAQAFPQLLPPHKALKYLEVGDLKGIEAMAQADEDQAYREHEKLLKGIPINSMAVQQTMAAVNQGMNPKTQAPIESDQEIQELLTEAAIAPLPVINPAIHIETHDLLIKSPEFENYPPEVQQRFIMHRMMEQEMLQSATPPDPRALPKTSVNLRGTLSAPVAARVLNAQGIQTTPDEVAEPPLETAVYDSMDKPDTDEAGNDPLTEQEQVVAQEQHQAEMAKASQQMMIADRQAQAKEVQAVAKLQQSEEQHQERMAQSRRDSDAKARQAEEMHQERVRQARKPKPSGKGD